MNIGPKSEVKYTTSHEDPQRVVHEVIRPIIQEVSNSNYCFDLFY